MAFIKNIPTNELPDKELVALFRTSRNMEVLAVLFQRYMDLLYGVCLKYLKQPETAKDAVMQIFEELVVKLPKHEVDNFKSWLYTLAKNHCLMQLRTPKNLKTTEFNPDSMQLEEEMHLNGIQLKEENLQKLERCLETLSTEQKKSVELFYLQNKCYKEIAEETGIEWNKVRSFIQNGRRNLKICMEKGVELEMRNEK
ncbi:RNA polymerase, sigma-24 subunit, ECF subfamily [Niastella koreensis GR20-10]|uniref:RNA polymerase, sigma-24 subunit, ECF subfamily n=2 Tax=Niastella koreensis TaxID=354356 RepID=G8TQS7_NIAKG|nr:sigma-70 family RNA polymerase sigma factor [Niastella koreensis]AEV96811.1 RNA polymerase, sigma-24 subunit, ECF subfamily [Niastella koreensis GR20-10]